jgi:hypothetical protein
LRNTLKILVEKPEGKRPLGKPRHKWDSIRLDLKGTAQDDVDWNHPAQDMDQSRALNSDKCEI